VCREKLDKVSSNLTFMGEAFGKVPKIKSKGKANEAVLNEKMQYYLQIYKKQPSPQAGGARRSRGQC
jgi:hypothetical protein